MELPRALGDCEWAERQVHFWSLEMLARSPLEPGLEGSDGRNGEALVGGLRECEALKTEDSFLGGE